MVKRNKKQLKKELKPLEARYEKQLQKYGGYDRMNSQLDKIISDIITLDKKIDKKEDQLRNYRLMVNTEAELFGP